MRVPLPSLQQVQESINPSFLFRAGMQLTSCSSSFPPAGVLRRFALHVRQVACLVDACLCVAWPGAHPTAKTGKGLVADALSGSFDRPVALDVFIFVMSALFLKQTLAKVDYSKLDGLENNSLARDAGAWALAGEVPVISRDGRFEVATFAGGCFWGTELHFQRMPGVIATCVGYTQGEVETPTYQQVCSGSTGHTEGIQLIYDPSLCSYEELCGKLLSTVDPTALNRVGNDRGIPSLNVTASLCSLLPPLFHASVHTSPCACLRTPRARVARRDPIQAWNLSPHRSANRNGSPGHRDGASKVFPTRRDRGRLEECTAVRPHTSHVRCVRCEAHV